MDIVWQTPANPPQPNDYIFRNGKRHVRPYYFEFISHAKCRWAGKTIVDLFVEEFRGRSYDYYVNAVQAGRIQVNGQKVGISHVVKSSQKISHFLHRHEPPVMAWDVVILQIEHDVVTVCKPPSVPVHPCGQYRKNTVVGILEAEHGLAPLFPVHRLDRLVSGLLILARNAAKADYFRQEQIVDANVYYNAREGRSSVELGNPPNTKAFKGKTACTFFTRISTNGTHSIVLCKPITGRTHQIRVHLQYVGHPIANDVLYVSEHSILFSGERTNSFISSISSGTHVSSAFTGSGNACCGGDEMPSIEEFSIDPMCTHCPNLAPKGYGGCEEALWLHCVRYHGSDWDYACPYPDWAYLC